MCYCYFIRTACQCQVQWFIVCHRLGGRLRLAFSPAVPIAPITDTARLSGQLAYLPAIVFVRVWLCASACECGAELRQFGAVRALCVLLCLLVPVLAEVVVRQITIFEYACSVVIPSEVNVMFDSMLHCLHRRQQVVASQSQRRSVGQLCLNSSATHTHICKCGCRSVMLRPCGST